MANPLKWHGGKHYLSEWIISLMPPRVRNPNAPDDDDPGWVHYVEPYAGGLAVLLAQDPEGISEVVCDTNRQLTNFWRVLQSDHLFRKFRRIVEATPFSEVEWTSPNRSLRKPNPAKEAAAFYVHCRQSMSGRMDSFAPLTRNRTRRGMNEQASAWWNAVEGLTEVHARMRRVAVLDGPALKVIRSQDGPRTLFYLDPPYLKSTRTAPDVFEHEMSDVQHRNLLEQLRTIKGRFILSGYRSDLYDEFARCCGWRREEMPIDNKSGKGATKQNRVECCWLNY